MTTTETPDKIRQVRGWIIRRLALASASSFPNEAQSMRDKAHDLAERYGLPWADFERFEVPWSEFPRDAFTDIGVSEEEFEAFEWGVTWDEFKDSFLHPPVEAGKHPWDIALPEQFTYEPTRADYERRKAVEEREADQRAPMPASLAQAVVAMGAAARESERRADEREHRAAARVTYSTGYSVRGPAAGEPPVYRRGVAASYQRHFQHLCNGQPVGGHTADCPTCGHFEAARAEEQALRDKADDAAKLERLLRGSAPALNEDDVLIKLLHARGYDAPLPGLRLGTMPTWRQRLHALAWGDERADRQVNIPMATPMASGVRTRRCLPPEPQLDVTEAARRRADLERWRRRAMAEEQSGTSFRGHAHLYVPLYELARMRRVPQQLWTSPTRRDGVRGAAWMAVLGHVWEAALSRPDVRSRDWPLLAKEVRWATSWYELYEDAGPVRVDARAAREAFHGRRQPKLGRRVPVSREVADVVERWAPPVLPASLAPEPLPDVADADVIVDVDAVDVDLDVRVVDTTAVDVRAVRDRLSPGARDILELLGDGWSYVDIAATLGVTEKVAYRLADEARAEGVRLCKAAGIVPNGAKVSP